MPSFPRLGKPGNRPQHSTAAEQPPPLPSGVTGAVTAAGSAQLGPGSGAGAGAGAGAGGGSGSGGGSGTSGGSIGSGALEADLPPPPQPPPADAPPAQPALSTSALSSNESFVDIRQTQQQLQQSQPHQQHQQHQQQQHQSTVPSPTHPYRPGPSSGANLLANLGSLDNLQQLQHQQQQKLPPGEIDPASLLLTAAQRYTLHQQQAQAQAQAQALAQGQQPHPLQLQQIYGTVSTTSLDDISTPAGYHQPHGAPHPPPAAPTEKRSTRKLIKGIFAKATGSQDQNHHNHNQSQTQNQSRTDNPIQSQAQSQSRTPTYDNAGGLVRRTSKRNSRIISPLNTIRHIAHDAETSSSYDEAVYHPQPLHTPGQVQVLATYDQQHQQQQQQQQQLQLQLQQHPYESQQVAYDQAHSPQSTSTQQYAYSSNSPQDPYHQTGDSHMSNSFLGTQQNPETISQLSHESPAPDIDQRSIHQQLDHAPSVTHYPAAQHSDPTTPAQPTQPPAMAPAGGPPPVRRGTDLEQMQAGPPSGYRNNSNLAPASPLPGQVPPSNSQYRGDRPPPQYDGAGGDQGRSSPQPSTTQERDTESEKAFKELLTKYKNVKRFYFEGKSQIEQLTSQIEHLQNAVANQRMSQSRTALDDNEYMTRFSRLNGAINNLSFNIRKDWRFLPQWLEKYVSADALKTGKQEMTAVGRAVISRWVVEELFNKCFHPGLDPMLSAQLKEVELGIRGNAHSIHSQEELDAHITKVVNWRMATLDGLQQKLGGPATSDNRSLLTTKATTNLTACLYQYLSTPPPHGVEGSTSTIVELAISIAANLPMESRDVSITYPLPGDILQPHFMEVEKAGLPPLDAHKSESEADGEDKEGFAADVSRVRLAGFVALEVRGRQVLMKAPVWTL